ncbi:MAG: hypothetical protein VX768_01035 [Planctomycetota bacterium]|nr:hypothetical protein [Planctomycetota bacterium]
MDAINGEASEAKPNLRKSAKMRGGLGIDRSASEGSKWPPT